MQSAKFFKKFLMPCGLCAAVPAVKPAHPPQDCPGTCGNESESKKLIRPSELPIYSLEDDCSKQMAWNDSKYTPSVIEETFGQIRRSVQHFIKEYQDITDSVTNKINTGMEHSHMTLDYLREESNFLPRFGAVGIGGLTGLILGLRGGKFKKIIYTSTGALAVAAVCYPKQAGESLEMAKHYANIGYNFVYGVKPGDEQLQIKMLEIPNLKMPTSLSEFLEMTIDTGSAVAGAASSLVNKAWEAVNEKKEGDSPSKPDSKEN